MTEPATQPGNAAAVLDRSRFFAVLPIDARAELLAAFCPETVEAGKVVVWEGDPGEAMYLIGSGTAEVWVTKGSGAAKSPARETGGAWSPDPRRQTLLARLGPGDVVGEMALLLGGRRTATVRAATDLELYALDRAAFARILDRHRGLAVALEEEALLRGMSAFLGKASPFATLPEDALRWLAARFEPITVAIGDVIVRAGEPGDAFYLVRSGRVEVLAPTDGGSDRVVATLGPGEPFGEQALVTGEPRTATVRAVEPTEVLRLRRADFETVVQEHRERGGYFLQLTLQRQRPRRIEHWVMERLPGHDGQPVFVLKDTVRHRYLKLSEQGAFLWDLMDGQRTVRDLTMAYFARYQTFGLDAVVGAMMQLSAAGFVRIQRIDRQRLGQIAPLNRVQRLGLLVLPWLTHYFAFPDIDGVISWLYRYVFRPLYSRISLILLLGAAVVGAAVFLGFLAAGGIHRPPGVGAGWLALAALVGFAVQGLLHELAHAITCKHFGREVHRAGVGWYVFMPVAFVDTSDIWLAGKWARAAVAFAGPGTNLILSGIASLALLVTSDPLARVVLFQFAVTGYVLGLFNLNPLLEFDGYYVLMDALDIPNLRSKALSFLGSVAWRRQPATRDRRLVRICAGYGVLTLGYTLFVAVSLLFGYQGYVQGAVARVVPHTVAAILGWVIAGIMAGLILLRAWTDLRTGATRPRPPRAADAASPSPPPSPRG